MVLWSRYANQVNQMGQRMGAWTAIGGSGWVYDGWNRIVELTNTCLQDTFTWGLDASGSLQGAGGVGGLLATRLVSSSNTDYFPTYDGNGNVSEYLGITGDNVSHYEYDPFGTLTRRTGSTSTRLQYRFSTKPRDFNTGLYYYGYRWYDPVTGRWPSRDPIEESGGVNLYGFVGNDGVGHFDLLGLVGDGHHIIPQAIWDNISEEVRAIWDSDRARIYDPCWGAHNSREMGGVKEYQYRDAVQKELDKFLKSRNISGLSKLTTNQAEAFLRLVKRMNGPIIGKYNSACRREVSQSIRMVRGHPPGAKVVWRRGIGLIVKSGLIMGSWWVQLASADAMGDGTIQGGYEFPWEHYLGAYSTSRLIGQDDFACRFGGSYGESCRKTCYYSATLWEVSDRNRHWDHINQRGVGGGIVHRPVGNGRFSISMPCHARCPVNPEGAFDVHADFWETRTHTRNIDDRVGSPSDNGIVE
jgi:RHS repeat-associated protein